MRDKNTFFRPAVTRVYEHAICIATGLAHPFHLTPNLVFNNFVWCAFGIDKIVALLGLLICV